MVVDQLKQLKSVFRFWKTFVVVLTPILLLPVALLGESSQAARCGYVMLLMATYWTTEALPLPATGLIPVALFPLLNIMTTDEVSREYFKRTNMMFVSALIMAIAVEHSNLHKRIALKVLMIVGTSARMLMLGFMVLSCFLSMWLLNTATTAMMIPIVHAVLDELEKDEEEMEGPDHPELHQVERNDKEEIEALEKRQYRFKQIRIMMFLSIAYSSNTGGTGTLTGTGANMVLRAALDTFPGKTPVNFASWMLFSCPAMVVNLFISWLWLQFLFMGIPRRTKDPKAKALEKKKAKAMKDFLREKYRALGGITFHEFMISVLFFILVMLWFLRDPQFIDGWGKFFRLHRNEYIKEDSACNSNCTYIEVTTEKDSVDDATSGMFIGLLLFIIPAQPNFWPFKKCGEKSQPSSSLMTWSVLQQKMPWGLIMLMGGGFALSKASQVSGLSLWMGEQLKVLIGLDSWVVVLLICVLTATATEVVSNFAMASILMPVLKNLALSLNVNPLYFMLPATLTCSYAFMLPVGNPNNALVYTESGVMSTFDMVKAGFVMNLISIVVTMIALNTYAAAMFDLFEMPDWI